MNRYVRFWENARILPNMRRKSARAETVFTEFAAAAVKDFVREEGVSPDILGFAGHTICHRPSEHYTHQIGDGRRLAELTGIKTAARFRSADILAGGQGAPFAPGVLRGADGQNAASAGGN